MINCGVHVCHIIRTEGNHKKLWPVSLSLIRGKCVQVVRTPCSLLHTFIAKENTGRLSLDITTNFTLMVQPKNRVRRQRGGCSRHSTLSKFEKQLQRFGAVHFHHDTGYSIQAMSWHFNGLWRLHTVGEIRQISPQKRGLFFCEVQVHTLWW